MTQVKLEELLSSLFVWPDELRRFLRGSELTRAVVEQLPGPNASKEQLVHAATQLLEARGGVDETLRRLADDPTYARRRHDIIAVREQWAQAQESLRNSPVVTRNVINRGAVGQQFNITGDAEFLSPVSGEADFDGVERALGHPTHTGSLLALINQRIAQARRSKWSEASLRPALEMLRADCRQALELPKFSDIAPRALRGVWILATLDLARFAASQLRYAESRHHLHEALHEAEALPSEERRTLNYALYVALTDILEAPPRRDIDYWAWARENVPPP